MSAAFAEAIRRTVEFPIGRLRHRWQARSACRAAARMADGGVR